MRYVAIHVACLLIMFYFGRLAMPLERHENARHATLFAPWERRAYRRDEARTINVLESQSIDFTLLCDRELAKLLQAEDRGAWNHVLCKLVSQESRSFRQSRKRDDWGVCLEELLGELYEDMIGRRKLWNYKGDGSLVGWMRSYLRGYLNRKNPNLAKTVDIDGVSNLAVEEGGLTVGDKISKEMSDGTALHAYRTEDLEVLRHERLEIAQRCFADLWKENSVQAYVMLLKVRFQMSSLEIKERLMISSTANVDQLFARAVRKMKELRVKHER